jgi:hypothetical protein
VLLLVTEVTGNRGVMGFFFKVSMSPSSESVVWEERTWGLIRSTYDSGASFHSPDATLEDKGAMAFLGALSVLSPPSLFLFLCLTSILYSVVILAPIPEYNMLTTTSAMGGH